jgi:hypothetical protein
LKSSWDADQFFHKEGALSNIILVDTPGGGDPQVRTDIVYNFLPICDTVVYCFNATNPLNTNDLPILCELNEVLQHTDFFYVYTRADNVFRIRDEESLVASNFDHAKAHRQQEIFAARLSGALAGMPARPPELMFVSNAAHQFGIDELRERVLQSPGDPTALALKKLAFFRTRSVESIERILKVLQDLRITVRELVTRAEHNHEVYNHKFEIRTEEIKDFWRNAQDILRKTLGRFKELQTKNIVSPLNLAALGSKGLVETKVSDRIEQFVKVALDDLTREIGHVGKTEFDTWKNALRDRLQKDGIQCIAESRVRAEINNTVKTVIDVSVCKRNFIVGAGDFARNVAIGAGEHVLSALSQSCKEIRSDLEKASRHCLEGELFVNERELRDGCKKEIASAIELYASLIELYVSGINTAGTMLLIERAALARDIDFLQSEKIDDDEKRATVEKVVQEIFGAEHQNLSAIEQRCRLFPQELKTLIHEVEANKEELESAILDIKSTRQSNLAPVLSSVWDDAMHAMIDRNVGWQEQQRENIISALTKEYDDALHQFEQQKARVIAGWKNTIFWVGIAGAIVISLLIGTYFQFKVGSLSQSWAEIALSGAIGNALWAAGVLTFRRARLNKTEWLASSRAEIFGPATALSSAHIRDKEIGSPTDVAGFRDNCRSRLKDWVSEVVSSYSMQMQTPIKPLAAELEAVRVRGLDLVEKYQRSWESGRQITEQLYRGSDEKVGRLKAVAAAFKERTIDRTRKLFGNRGIELEQYIDQLSGYAQEMQKVQ